MFDTGKGGSIALGRDCWLYRDVEIRTDGVVAIGDGTSLQKGVTINGSVVLGRGCIVAPHVFLSSGKHIYDLRPAWPIRLQEKIFEESPELTTTTAGWAHDKPIRIDEDCWIGAHVLVTPGVRIGRGAIIGANAVVTKDVSPYEIVGGVPARRIGRRLEWSPPAALDASNVADVAYFYQGFHFRSVGTGISIELVDSAAVVVRKFSKGDVVIRIHASSAGEMEFEGSRRSYGKGEQCLAFHVEGGDFEELFGGRLIRLRRSGGSDAVRILGLRCVEQEAQAHAQSSTR